MISTNPPATNTPATSQTSIEALWKLHYRSVVRSARRILHREDLAEEVAQQAFVDFIENGCVPSPGKEGAYLRRMTVNLALTHLRRQKLEDRYSSGRPSVDPSAEDEAIRRTDSERLSKSIGRLSPQQQSVIVHRHLRGLTGQETATSLGISTGSVKTHSSRARATLRFALADAR